MALDPLGTYSFLPWLRRGIATTITGSPQGSSRATVPVDLLVTGDKVGGGTITQAIHRDVQLYGPGDIVGLDARAIFRMEPRHWITDFEPNYLPFVEFYDEDLPWRYTPAAPGANNPKRLTPWLALVVLSDAEGAEEFEDGEGAAPGAPLPHITVDDAALFPPADAMWAWAHVHVNRSLSAASETFSDDAGGVLGRFDNVMADNPDHGSARLICPRALQPNTPYHAFVVPTFESGRLAGLGLDPEAAPSATASAWAAYNGREQPTRYPYYHRWYFRTGNVGDFEYLVRLLQPRKVDPRVGQRDMDVQEPGADLPGVTDPSLGGVLRLGGALQIPEVNLDQAAKQERLKYENWDQPYPHAFQEDLAELVNLADDYLSGDASDPDPVITPPLYGRWHALTNRLLESPPTPPATLTNWVHELNLDPRWRVPAGFGTQVVQTNQEDYMAAAWNQIGAVLEANRRMRLAQLAREVGRRLHGRHLHAQLAADPGRVLALTGPVQRRVLADGVTVRHRVATSVAAAATVSTAMRRIARPGGRLIRRSGFEGGPAEAARLVARVARGEITAAPPKRAPRIPTGNVVAKRLAGRIGTQHRDLIDLLSDVERDRRLIDGFPRVPDFQITKPTRDPRQWDRGERDSPAAEGLKIALGELADVVTASTKAGHETPRDTLDVEGLAAQTLEALHPDVTIPRRVLDGLHIPLRLRDLVVEELKEAMAYPEIEIPMYKPLVDLSSELFLPNVNLIEQNSITLLETNQRFIESYMVGLNHELARELLWREYPTDQRGSYFRQFWDPKTQMSLPGETPEQRRERLRDIPPLHLWSRASNLGQHDNRELVPGTAEEEVVLVIRGELLKRYPTAVIYAQKAAWPKDSQGHDITTGEREPIHLTSAEQAATPPPAAKLRLPLYEAKIDPDIYFFGFDLTAEDAKGDVPNGDLGWFFVIRERPGEPRFGLDINRDGGLNVWNDLAWPDANPNQEPFIPAGAGAPTRNLTEPTAQADQEKHPQWDEDKALHWGSDLNSSEVAYILWQAPVLVAVHAEEMLGT